MTRTSNPPTLTKIGTDIQTCSNQLSATSSFSEDSSRFAVFGTGTNYQTLIINPKSGVNPLNSPIQTISSANIFSGTMSYDGSIIVVV
jgi:hypothetical protein